MISMLIGPIGTATANPTRNPLAKMTATPMSTPPSGEYRPARRRSPGARDLQWKNRCPALQSPVRLQMRTWKAAAFFRRLRSHTLGQAIRLSRAAQTPMSSSGEIARRKATAVSETFEPVLIIAGLVLCLFGWTLYWTGLRLVGAACGALLGAACVGALLLLQEDSQWFVIGMGAGAAVGAVLGLFLIKRAHFFLFFVAGAVLGLAIAWFVEDWQREWLSEHLPGAVGRAIYYALCSLAGGVLLLLAHRVVVIVLTAVVGAGLLALGMPSKYAVWLFLPILLGSMLLQMGILSALGEPATLDELEEE
jgi:hypothetical protein